jgi:hypothetical protein
MAKVSALCVGSLIPACAAGWEGAKSVQRAGWKWYSGFIVVWVITLMRGQLLCVIRGSTDAAGGRCFGGCSSSACVSCGNWFVCWNGENKGMCHLHWLTGTYRWRGTG